VTKIEPGYCSCARRTLLHILPRTPTSSHRLLHAPTCSYMPPTYGAPGHTNHVSPLLSYQCSTCVAEAQRAHTTGAGPIAAFHSSFSAAIFSTRDTKWPDALTYLLSPICWFRPAWRIWLLFFFLLRSHGSPVLCFPRHGSLHASRGRARRWLQQTLLDCYT
jgi:hypothetical protein